METADFKSLLKGKCRLEDGISHLTHCIVSETQAAALGGVRVLLIHWNRSSPVLSLKPCSDTVC